MGRVPAAGSDRRFIHHRGLVLALMTACLIHWSFGDQRQPRGLTDESVCLSRFHDRSGEVDSLSSLNGDQEKNDEFVVSFKDGMFVVACLIHSPVTEESDSVVRCPLRREETPRKHEHPRPDTHALAHCVAHRNSAHAARDLRYAGSVQH